MRTTTAGSGKDTIGIVAGSGSARVLEGVVGGERALEAGPGGAAGSGPVLLGERALEGGLVEPPEDDLVLLGVAHALGEREARSGQEHGAEGEEALHPGV